MIKKIIEEGGQLPTGYAPAYDLYDPEFSKDHGYFKVVCYPIPLNIIIHYIRKWSQAWVWKCMRIDYQQLYKMELDDNKKLAERLLECQRMLNRKVISSRQN